MVNIHTRHMYLLTPCLFSEIYPHTSLSPDHSNHQFSNPVLSKSLLAYVLSHFSFAWLFATLWTVAPPGSFVHGISQGKLLEWIAMLSSRGSSQPRIELMSLMSPALADSLFTTSATWEGPKSLTTCQTISPFPGISVDLCLWFPLYREQQVFWLEFFCCPSGALLIGLVSSMPFPLCVWCRIHHHLRRGRGLSPPHQRVLNDHGLNRKRCQRVWETCSCKLRVPSEPVWARLYNTVSTWKCVSLSTAIPPLNAFNLVWSQKLSRVRPG